MVCGVDKFNEQNHAEIDTIPYPQKCRKSAFFGLFFNFRYYGGIGRAATLPGRVTLFSGTSLTIEKLSLKIMAIVKM